MLDTPQKRYAKRNPAKRAAWTRAHQGRVRAAALAALGGKCARCGWDDARALQVDHVTAIGKGRPKTMQTWRDALANPERYQLLCANHNWVKRYENNEVPRLYA